MKLASTLSLLTLALLAPTPSAEVWTVDDDGGAGVDFPDVQSAIDAAQPGDRIEIAPGTYDGFDLTAGLALEGPSEGFGATVVGPVLVHDLPGGEEARLVDLFLDSGLVARNCAGRVLVEEGSLRGKLLPYALQVVDCADVRVFRTNITGTGTADPTAESVHVRDARLELVQVRLTGQVGASSFVQGGTGLRALSGAAVLVAASQVQGGNGWDPNCFDPFGFEDGGPGGDAIVVEDGAVVTIAGRDTALWPTGAPRVVGGWGGGCDCVDVGTPGLALRVAPGGLVRHSETPLLAGDVLGCFRPPVLDVEPGGVLETVGAVLPTLAVQAAPDPGQPQPGASLLVEVFGAEGAGAVLLAGFGALDLPLAGVEGSLLAVPTILVPLGSVPAGDLLQAALALPASLAPGAPLHLQAVTVAGGAAALSNSNLVYVN